MGSTLTDLGNVFVKIVGWFGDVIGALFGTVTEGNATLGTWGDMLAFVFIGCAISIILTGVHVIKSLTFGRG